MLSCDSSSEATQNSGFISSGRCPEILRKFLESDDSSDEAPGEHSLGKTARVDVNTVTSTISVKQEPGEKLQGKTRRMKFCNICDDRKPLLGMREHMLKEHLAEDFIFCQLCSYSTKHKYLYYQHNFNKHENQKHVLPIDRFHEAEDAITSLISHMTEETIVHDENVGRESTMGVCRFCKGKPVRVFKHARRYHQDKNQYLCPECPYENRDCAQGVNNHIRMHHPSSAAKTVSLVKVFFDRIKPIASYCFKEDEESEGLPPPGFLRYAGSPKTEEKINFQSLIPQKCSRCGETEKINFEAHALRHYKDDNPEEVIIDAYVKEKQRAADLTGSSIPKTEGIGSASEMESNLTVLVPREVLSKICLACFGFDLNGWTKNAYKRHEKRLKEAIALEEERTKKQAHSQPASSLKLHPCTLCNAKVAAKQFHQHAANKHLGIPLISCPICGKTEKYQRRNIVSHITKAHPHVKGAEPIDRRKQFHAELVGIIQKCFPSYYRN